MTINNAVVSIVTPTEGKDSLFNLIGSVISQGVPVNHILLWDDSRKDKFLLPDDNGHIMQPSDLEKEEKYAQPSYAITNIILPGSMIQGQAKGSALRAVGLMAANTEYVTFADDDIVWEENHLISMLEAMGNKNWAFCKRKIWCRNPNGYEYLGVDEFESVGEEAKTPYKMVDNNCMMFRRRFGSSAACLYRETLEYNDDRLMYAFLKNYAGEPAITRQATINQICPDKLINFFKVNCTLAS